MLINLCFGLSSVSSSATVLCINGISAWINPLGVFTSHVMSCSMNLFFHTPLPESLPTLREAINFPSTELATHDHVHQYDLSYLSTNPPLLGDDATPV
jgi:hypothetical protein